MNTSKQKGTINILWLATLFFHLVDCRLPISNRLIPQRIINNLFEEIRSQQSVLFTSNDEIIPESQALIQALSHRTSNYIVNVAHSRSIGLKFFSYPRHSTLYFILKKGDDKKLFVNAQDVLWKIGELSSVVTRPRCLMIIYGRLLGIRKDDYHKAVVKLLNYAWSLKFLDFTIIHLISRRLPMIFYLNPFQSNAVNFQNTDTFNSSLMPKKLVNCSNYTVHVPLIMIKDISCLFKDKNGKVENYAMNDKNVFVFLKQFFEYTQINVLWDLYTFPRLAGVMFVRRLIKQLAKNKSQFLFFYYAHFGNSSLVNQVETSRYFEWMRYEIFVPNIKSSEIQIPWIFLETGSLFTSIVLTHLLTSLLLAC